MRFLLIVAFAFLSHPAFSSADKEAEVRKVRNAVETCLKQRRANCVIENTTKILSSSGLSGHILDSDPLALDWYIKVFSKATYDTANEGRAIFKRYMVENGIWTLEMHSEIRRHLDLNRLGDMDIKISMAGFSLLRAAACNDLGVPHCTRSAARQVYNAQTLYYWDKSLERFEIEDEKLISVMDSIIASEKESLEQLPIHLTLKSTDLKLDKMIQNIKDIQ